MGTMTGFLAPFLQFTYEGDDQEELNGPALAPLLQSTVGFFHGR